MSGARALLVAALLIVGGLVLATPAAAADLDPDGGEGIGLQAVVGGSAPAPAPGAGSGLSAGSGSVPADVPLPPDAAVAEPVVPLDVSSVLDVSGLRTTYRAALDPTGGRLVVRFVVRNSSHRTVDASARFWATTVAGHRIGSAPKVPVNGLAPGESRTVSQDIDGVGQWTLVTAHAELAPVAPAGAPPVEPVVRDRSMLVVPWAAIVLVLVVAAGVISARLSGDRGRPPVTQPVAVA